MIITFSSAAASNVIMFGESALELLRIMGKAEEHQGIITVAQLPTAIARLKAAIAGQAPSSPADEDHSGAETKGLDLPVGLRQRAFPVLELCQRGLKKNKPVIWQGNQ